jgi:hypothetical protein
MLAADSSSGVLTRPEDDELDDEDEDDEELEPARLRLGGW